VAWWSSLSESLAERRTVYVLDLPRLGRRRRAAELAAWLGRWLQAAALERVDLVGHPLGGLVAAELAAFEPERIRRLVLVAPAGISMRARACRQELEARRDAVRRA
jgi:pyruvate dehydrogenase E2 component (dihydrolipoamide acetyltransferase)